MLSDRLGLNPKAMRALMWQVAEESSAPQRATGTDGRSARKGTTKSRRHLKAVDEPPKE